ncbi:hypothetical protein KP509_26G027200 [Ceratopteris richardii]|uniref:non-specific serine/threonine protein kinase n=1 Tax=Ceratopteris richardii TaxID=49495 RepID=A0A8T2RL47_CERRI|nr:hypothetical protein KP509_26G027200 [Ceratopteris richardii]KAH7296544.1 hypothetical protein KP509_26G027200 [Ceratopteris richardii]
MEDKTSGSPPNTRVIQDSALSGSNSKRISFRAPQAPFTAKDFSYGKLLGLGSYSKVVQATKKDTGVTYALKIMDKLHIVKENTLNYVKLERILLDQLDHPGVVQLHFTFQDAHYLYMGLECCEGGELFHQIQRKKRLSVDEARFYASELIDIMEYLHGQGLIHRDLKPENLLLTRDGHLKVIDFGSAKSINNFNGLVDIPDDKGCTLVGTAEYVSPEVLDGQPATMGTDLWALGCIVYQMLVGRPPFKCATEYLTFQKILNRDFEFPEFLSAEARDLIDRLLDLDPSRRLGVGADGFATLKAHSFFQGTEWSELWKSPAPLVAPPPESDIEGETTDDEDNELHPDWAFAHLEGVDKLTNKLEVLNVNKPEESSNISSYESDRRFKDSTDSGHRSTVHARSCFYYKRVSREKNTISRSVEKCRSCFLEAVRQSARLFCMVLWNKLLLRYKPILMISVVKEHEKLSSGKRILILTGKPSLFYIDPRRMSRKWEIMWSDNADEMSVHVKNDRVFSIYTPKRMYYFEDEKSLAWRWKNIIERVQRKQRAQAIQETRVPFIDH